MLAAQCKVNKLCTITVSNTALAISNRHEVLSQPLGRMVGHEWPPLSWDLTG
jgi:hypothetical protein